MGPLERYLQRVGFWLPRDQKQDILLELSEGIRSELEQQERDLGRKPNDPELLATLERWGDPAEVAQRFLPRRFLIGPAIYPSYELVLKAIATFYVLPWLVVWLVLVLFLPWYRQAHPGFAPLGALWPLVRSVAFAFTGVTVAFAAKERAAGRPAQSSRSDASGPLAAAGAADAARPGAPNAPADTSPDRMSRSLAISHATGWVVFLLWWVDTLRLPQPPELRLDLAPFFTTLWWPILAAALAAAALAGFVVAKPSRTETLVRVRLVLRGVSLLLIGILLAAGLAHRGWIDLGVPDTPARSLASLAWWINLSCALLLALGGVSAAVGALQDTRLVMGRPLARHWAMTLLARD